MQLENLQAMSHKAVEVYGRLGCTYDDIIFSRKGLLQSVVVLKIGIQSSVSN